MSQPDTAFPSHPNDVILEAHAISPYLIQLTYRNLLSCYLVASNSGYILVDTLLPNWSNALLSLLQKQNLPITHILLTHAHHDHAGGLEAVHNAWPSAEIALTAREARLLAGDLTVDATIGDNSPNPLKGKYTHSPVSPTRLLKEGDKIGDLEVILAEGHTPGHAVFFDTRDRTVIAGDTFQTLGQVVVAGIELPHFPQPARATWSKELALQSARKLLTYSPSRLAVAHGTIIEEPLALMEQAVLTATHQYELVQHQ